MTLGNLVLDLLGVRAVSKKTKGLVEFSSKTRAGTGVWSTGLLEPVLARCCAVGRLMLPSGVLTGSLMVTDSLPDSRPG